MNIYQRGDLGKILSENTYPGRGIVVGLTPDGKKAALVYFIMGRSENSRNRIFRQEGENVTIYPFDASKVEDPSLIIYSPIKVCGAETIVTNGDQTDTVYDFLKEGKSFEEALNTRCFEPDFPNFTPRISAVLHFTDASWNYQMSILKSADEEGSACNRYTYSYAPIAGVGHFIHTYLHDGNPIPTFCGEPERVEIPLDIDTMTDLIWNNLNEQNRISLYVRYIDLESGSVENRLINKHE